MAQAAAAPADDADDDEAADAGAGAGEGEDQGHDEQVLVTICKAADGSYTVHQGDEPEGGDEEEGEETGAASDSYDTIGAVLKATMDILQKDAEGGDGGAQDQMEAGYAGGSAASPAKGGGGMMGG